MTNTATPGAEVRQVLDLLDGFRASKAVFTAVSLGVFDRLHRGAATSGQLAADLDLHAGALERLLGACVGLGVLRLEASHYENEPVAERFLRRESPETLAGYILYSDRILFRLWSHLGEAVRTGGNAWQSEFGAKEGLFDHFFATEEEKRTFLAGMHGLGSLSSPVVVTAFDLSRFRRLADVGGATGHLVISACSRYPALEGVLFDLPAVTPVAADYIGHSGLEKRISIVAGDFFTDPLPEADLYALGRILHDWTDEKVRRLIGKIYHQLPEGGGLLVCEKLLNERRDGPATAYLQSLNMLICTEGRERTASEYEALLREAGFREFQARPTGQPVDAMLALK